MTMQQLTEDLASLREISEKARFASMENGRYLIVWGLAISAGMAYSEIQSRSGLNLSPWVVWVVTIGAAWIYTAFTSMREKRDSRVKSLLGRALARHWITVGISMTIAFLAGGLSGVVPSHAVAGLTATFLAIAMMSTAEMTNVRWLAIVAALWWVSAFALFLLPASISGVALVGCLLALFVAPGIALEAEARRVGARLV